MRAGIFIDGGYLTAILKGDREAPRISYERLSDHITGEGYERLRTYFYYCMPYQSDPPTPEEAVRYSRARRWVSILQRLPRFEVRLGKLERREGSFEQKRVDVLLAVDLVRMSWDHQIQKAVLITGDSDFVPAVEAAKDAGVLVHLYYSERTAHRELLDACDERTPISQDLIDACVLGDTAGA